MLSSDPSGAIPEHVFHRYLDSEQSTMHQSKATPMTHPKYVLFMTRWFCAPPEHLHIQDVKMRPPKWVLIMLAISELEHAI